MKKLLCILLFLGFAELPFAQDISIEGRGFTQPASAGAAIQPGQILKLDANGRFIPVTTADSSGAFSIAQTGASQAGVNFRMAIYGYWPILVDGACSVGQILSISSTVNGSAHCASGPVGQQIGTAISPSSTAGTIQANLNFNGTGNPTFPGGISSSSYNNVLNAASAHYSGSDIAAQFNSAEASADCPSTGCEIHIPVGTGNYNFSTQLVINKTISLVCDGVGGMANGGSRQNTTLTWTGAASAAILISGSSATASKVKGCALNNTGTGTVGIDLDSGANDVQLEDIPIVLPTVPFSVAAFRVGNTGIVVNPQFKHTVARAAAPIGYDILNVQSHFVGIELRGNSNTVADVVLGQASSSVQSFDCYGCIFETASGVNSVVFQRVEGAHFYGGYDEAGGVATTYPFDIPTTSTLARNISFDGMFFSCIRATCANAPVHSNFGSAMVDIQNSYVVGYGTNSLFQNDAVQRAHITGNDIFSNGAVASSFTNVDQCGNGVNSVIVACSFTGISSAGPIGTGTPAPGTFTSITATGSSLVTSASTVVGSLPSAASNSFAQIGVTDSTAVAAEGQTCVGGSSNKAIAVSNGSVWKCF